MTGHTSFTCFSKFPREVQDMIWKLSYDQRILEVIGNPSIKPDTVEEDLPNNEQELAFAPEARQVPALLHASHDARRVGLRMYSKLSFVCGEIYFNPEWDTIYFGEKTDGITAIEFLAQKVSVQHIACDIWIWKQAASSVQYQRHLTAFRKFHNLSEITFVSHQDGPSRKTEEKIKRSFRKERTSQMSLLRRKGICTAWKVPRVTFATLNDRVEGCRIEFSPNQYGKGEKNPRKSSSTTRERKMMQEGENKSASTGQALPFRRDIHQRQLEMFPSDVRRRRQGMSEQQDVDHEKIQGE